MSSENVLPAGLGDEERKDSTLYTRDVHMLKKVWRRVKVWLTDTSTMLPVLPASMKSWPVGYIMAMLAQLLATALVILSTHVLPPFSFVWAPALFAALLIYLLWGVAAGVFATLLGALYLAYFSLPFHFSLQLYRWENVINTTIYLLLCFTIGFLVSNTQRIRIAAVAAQLEARATRQQLYAILLQSPTPITILRGPEHIVDIVHERTQQVAGDRELVGKPFREAFPEYEGQGFFELVEQVYRTGEAVTVLEMQAETMHYEHGQMTPVQRFFNVIYYPLRSSGGETDGVAIFNVDITEQVQARKQMEEMLQEREIEHDRLQIAVESEQVLRLMAESAARQLQTVLDILPVGVSMVDAQGKLIKRNKAAEQIWGEQLAALNDISDYASYKGWWSQTGEPLETDDWGLLAAVEQGETANGYEVDIEALDGQRKTILYSSTPILDEQGSITGALSVQIDISERKRLEQTLRETERLAVERAQKLETVFEAITDAVFILNARTAPPQLNHAARTLLEIPDDQTIATDMEAPFELLDTQGRPLTNEEWPENRLRMGESLLSENAADVLLRTRSGRVYALSITGAPLYSEDGKVIGGVLVARNVTERRELEQQTQESLRTLLMLAEALVSLPMNDEAQNEKGPLASPLETVGERLVKLIRAVLDCQRVSMTTLDPETGELRSVAVVGLGEELERQWRERDHRPGFHLRDLLEGTPVVEQLAAGEVVFVDMREPPFDRQPNPYGIVTMLMAPMRIGTRLIGMLALDDNGNARLFSEGERALTKAVAELAALIMERERLQEERAVNHANILALQEANRLKDEFIGIAGHELRTPLTTIKASVQLAKRQITRMQNLSATMPLEVASIVPTLQNLLDRAERQVGMQNRLVSDLLDVSRIEVGQLELHPTLNDVQRLVQETVEDQQALTPERQINLELATVDELLILGDSDRLRQVVINYLTNALKYSESSKPVFVRVIELEREIRVEVEDRGPGLSEVQQQRIWERFYRVPEIEVKSGSGVGLGLGLHISRTIIERHGGRVGVRSTPGKGSTFWLTVPKVE